MTKPTLNFSLLDGTSKSWDADLNDNFDSIADLFQNFPHPIKEYASISTPPDATNYDRCLAFIEDGTSGWCLHFSDGTSWKLIPKQAASQSSSVATTVAGIVADFNSLLGKLRAAGVIDT